MEAPGAYADYDLANAYSYITANPRRAAWFAEYSSDILAEAQSEDVTIRNLGIIPNDV